MTDYWFTEKERKEICVDRNCIEHGSGSNECKIPSEMPESSDNSISFLNSNATCLVPEVEVKYSNSNE